MHLDHLPPRIRAQAEAQLAAEDARRAKQPDPQHVVVCNDKPAAKGPNKTEASYRRAHIDTRDDVRAVWYEGLTFRMANGHRYTPDWIVARRDGRIECHEVKGKYRFGSHQRARLAFDQARVEFPEFVWVWGTIVYVGVG